MRERNHRTWYMTTAVVSAVVLAATAAYASVPDAGGVIHGCYQ